MIHWWIILRNIHNHWCIFSIIVIIKSYSCSSFGYLLIIFCFCTFYNALCANLVLPYLVLNPFFNFLFLYDVIRTFFLCEFENQRKYFTLGGLSIVEAKLLDLWKYKAPFFSILDSLEWASEFGRLSDADIDPEQNYKIVSCLSILVQCVFSRFLITYFAFIFLLKCQ